MKPLSLPHALRFPLILIITLFCKANPAFSQASNIVPDNTLGDESSQVIENADGQPNEVITGGAQREQNLFHSFQEFNVSEGRGAFFANPEAVNNIFSRVTGSNPSNILGELGVNGAANLYLINPNGIVFGENSSLNVEGSFTATTGNGIRFGQQGEFNTINPQTPQSLTVNPSAYLFNQIANQDINSIQSQGSLQVPEGENIVLLGGDINLKGGLVALGGTVELGSVNDTGEIGISEDENLIFSDEVARGDISLSEGSLVFVSGVGEGFINVYSQNLTLTEGSRIVAGIFRGFGDSDTVGGDIIIDVSGTVSLDDSKIENNIAVNAEGSAGNIEITTGSLGVTNGAFISTETFGIGDGGNISIDATESVIVDGENSDGESSRISSDARERAEGNAGNLEIATGSLEVTNGAFISTDINGGAGGAGNIFVNATQSVAVDGENSDGVSSKISSEAFGSGGPGEITSNIDITTGSLKVTNGGSIFTDSSTLGNAGNIFVDATQSVIVDGKNSNGVSSRISSDAVFQSLGDGGDIKITTGSLEITNGASISTQATSIRSEDGGEILIDADFILLGEDSIITSRTNQEGNAGNIILNVSNTLILENSSISNSSSSNNPFINSTGGEIRITGGDIRLQGDSDLITLVSNGAGGGGDITITADSIIAFDDSDILAFAEDGRGGNITLNTPVFFGENFTSNSLTSNPALLQNNSRVDLNATGAVSGEVSTPDVSFIQNSLSELPDNSLDTNELLANSCVVPIGNREQGRFIITGGESLPVRPGDSLPSKYPTGEVRSLPDNDNSWQPGDRIVEPQGAYRLANGKLVLSRKCQ